MKLHYVIAAWGGPRRSDDPRAQVDRTFFLRTHLERLARVRHDLQLISVVVPDGDNESPAFRAYLAGLPHPVLRRRSNAGFSYGSFTRAYELTRGLSDGYIFVEDDYVFVEDHFDQHLLQMASDAKADLVCGAVLPFRGDGALHPGVALGYCSTAALDRWAWFGSDMPHDRCDGGSYQKAEQWQVTWGANFAALGLTMADWLPRFATPYWTCTDEVRWYGARDARPLVVPIQAVDRDVPRHAADQSWADTWRV